MICQCIWMNFTLWIKNHWISQEIPCSQCCTGKSLFNEQIFIHWTRTYLVNWMKFIRWTRTLLCSSVGMESPGWFNDFLFRLYEEKQKNVLLHLPWPAGCTKYCDHTLWFSCDSANRQTDTHTDTHMDGTVSITSTADAGGSNPEARSWPRQPANRWRWSILEVMSWTQRGVTTTDKNKLTQVLYCWVMFGSLAWQDYTRGFWENRYFSCGYTCRKIILLHSAAVWMLKEQNS